MSALHQYKCSVRVLRMVRQWEFARRNLSRENITCLQAVAHDVDMGTVVCGTALGATTGIVVGGTVGSVVEFATGDVSQGARACGSSVGAIQGSVVGTILGILAMHEISTDEEIQETTTTIVYSHETNP